MITFSSQISGFILNFCPLRPKHGTTTFCPFFSLFWTCCRSASDSHSLCCFLTRPTPPFRQENVKQFLAEQDWTPEEKQAFMQQQYEKESSFLRLRRRRTALNDFAILALLGRGGYGEVYLCRKIDTGEVLALKRMKKSRFTEKNDVSRVMKEREVMVKSNSPWLARLKYCFQTETHLYMAMVRFRLSIRNFSRSFLIFLDSVPTGIYSRWWCEESTRSLWRCVRGRSQILRCRNAFSRRRSSFIRIHPSVQQLNPAPNPKKKKKPRPV